MSTRAKAVMLTMTPLMYLNLFISALYLRMHSTVHYPIHEYPVSGSSSQQCHGIPLKVSCLFSSILDHYKDFSRQSVI